MKSITELTIEYVYYSWDFEFQPDIEEALERDYVLNSYLYDQKALHRVKMLLLILPGASTAQVLEAVRDGRTLAS